MYWFGYFLWKNTKQTKNPTKNPKQTLILSTPIRNWIIWASRWNLYCSSFCFCNRCFIFYVLYISTNWKIVYHILNFIILLLSTGRKSTAEIKKFLKIQRLQWSNKKVGSVKHTVTKRHPVHQCIIIRLFFHYTKQKPFNNCIRHMTRSLSKGVSSF